MQPRVASSELSMNLRNHGGEFMVFIRRDGGSSISGLEFCQAWQDNSAQLLSQTG